MTTNSTTRFSDRVENYIKFRPTYPSGIIDFMMRHMKLSSTSVIADIGSGTGILSELFLKNGSVVFGVEPNAPMREAAEKLLRDYSNFISIDATAEESNLSSQSVDFVVAGQAFHWFDVEKCKAEFRRILKPKGWVVLVWNDRRLDDTPFLAAYETLLKKYALNYTQVNHQNLDDSVFAPFFGSDGYQMEVFDNVQQFDFAGLKGRLLSSSYAPMPGHPNHAPMIEELRSIFECHQQDGQVKFEYDTKVYYGHLE